MPPCYVTSCPNEVNDTEEQRSKLWQPLAPQSKVLPRDALTAPSALCVMYTVARARGGGRAYPG